MQILKKKSLKLKNQQKKQEKKFDCLIEGLTESEKKRSIERQKKILVFLCVILLKKKVTTTFPTFSRDRILPKNETKRFEKKTKNNN